MAKQVVWTKNGLNKYGEIISYLQEAFSQNTAAKLDKTVKEKLAQLAQYPEIGQGSKRHKSVRFIRIDKHRRLYYRVSGNRLFVVYFFDTRQDPSKNLYS